ncbi:MAG: ATPase [Candidatus Binatus sp.]|nr:ATPase [Candidatus Binatus sp.]
MRIFSDCANGSADKLATDRGSVQERIRANLSGVVSIIALSSAKGGVGKSMLAVNLGASIALKGRKVAIFDADLNSPSIAGMLGLKMPRRLPMIEGIEPAGGPHGLRLVSSELVPGGEPDPISFADGDGDAVSEMPPRRNSPVEMSYNEALVRILTQTRFGNLDLLIVDLASGLDRLYAVAQLLPIDLVLMLSHPSSQAARAARHAIKIAIGHGNAVVRIVENMVGFNCDGCRSVRPLWPEGDLQGVSREVNAAIVARLAFEPRLADSTDRGTLFVREFAATPTGKTMIDLATQIETMLASRVRPAQASA